MRSTGTDQPVRAMKAGNAAGAKGLDQAVVFNVQLATGGDLGGNEAVRHPGADAVRLLGGSGVSREAPAPFCERPEVKLLRPTRPMFSDFKTRGFGLEDSQIRLAGRLDRLILIMALALFWAVSTGMWDAAHRPTGAEKNPAMADPGAMPDPSPPCSSGACGAFTPAFTA